MRKGRDEREARLATVAKLWCAGLAAFEIAGQMARSTCAVQGDLAMLQARGTIAKRRTVNQPGRPDRGLTAPADRARSKAQCDDEKTYWAKAKRVVTIAQTSGELRVIKFFGDCAEAMAASRASIAGVRPGLVVCDEVFMASRGGKSSIWVLSKRLAGVAA